MSREISSWKKIGGLAALLTALGLLFHAWYVPAYPRSPLSGAQVFLISYLAILAAFVIPGVGRTFDRAMTAFSGFLTRRNVFVSNPESDAPKLALLRIVFGIFLVHRAYNILEHAFPADLFTPLIITVMVLNLLAGLMVLFGAFTQLGLLYLIFFQWHFGDAYLGTLTLGNDVGAIFGFLLLLSSSGAHLSVDGYFMRKGNLLGRILALGYAERGLPSAQTLQLSKFMALTGYWLVCTYSLATHIGEEAWTTGVAGPLVLTNNFMMNHFDIFVAIFSNSEFATHVARVTIWTMMFWYATIVPFVILGGIFRWYVIGWGLLFFALSTFLLNLGWLGIFEFIFWAALFWNRAFIASPRGYIVAFDDKCNFCDRTIKVIKFLDIFRAIELLPASTNKQWLEERGITYDAAMKDLFGFSADGERKFAGYDFYVELSRRVFLLLPFYPLLVIGRKLRFGPRLYRVIADYRLRIAGVCTLPTRKQEYDYSINVKSVSLVSVPFAFSALLVHFLLCATAYAIQLPLPDYTGARHFLKSNAPMAAWRGRQMAHFYGVAPINVFNSVDLGMAEHWFTITAVYPDNRKELLPVFDTDGSRLEWHESDRVYFGNTLRYRRGTRSLGPLCYRDRDELMLTRFMSMHEWESGEKPLWYIVDYFYQPLPAFEEIIAGKYIAEPVTRACRIRFKFTDYKTSIGFGVAFENGELELGAFSADVNSGKLTPFGKNLADVLKEGDSAEHSE